MRILATSDMHGDLSNIDLNGIDIACLAGDIAPLKGFGPWHVYDQVKWMRTKFKKWCESWPSTDIIFIPGNHDFFPLAESRFKVELAKQDLSLSLAPNAHMILDECIDVKGVKIYGSPWIPVISYRWAFEVEHDILVEKFKKIPENVDILLTHTPPRLNYVDVSLEHGIFSEKFGSHELADAIVAKTPKICICGHIHSGDHNKNILHETEVHNVSRVNESYAVAYEPLVFEK